MIIVLMHWRIRPEKKYVEDFLKTWNTDYVEHLRKKRIVQFLGEPVDPKTLPLNITWHLDPESLGNHKSYVSVELWESEKILDTYTDNYPMASFEKYCRRRIVLKPKCWLIGDVKLPMNNSGRVG